MFEMLSVWKVLLERERIGASHVSDSFSQLVFHVESSNLACITGVGMVFFGRSCSSS